MVQAQELTRLAGILAHEIRNPLASAVTNLAVASDLMEPSDPRAPFLRRAESELDRIRDLLSACLGLATAGKVHREPVDVCTLVREILARREPMPAGIEIESSVQEPTTFDLDRELLGRCLENLIENAVRVSGENGCRIRIQARSQEKGLILTIEDSGPGVPESIRETLFDAFVSGGGGSGLGLCFVRLVMEAHGGSAEIRASELGGARFDLFLAAPEGGS